MAEGGTGNWGANEMDAGQVSRERQEQKTQKNYSQRAVSGEILSFITETNILIVQHGKEFVLGNFSHLL